MSVDQIAAEVVRFVLVEVVNDPSMQLGPDDPIIEQGLIDSMGIIRLLIHLQRTYGVGELDHADIVLDNFRSARHVAVMFDRYLGDAPDRRSPERAWTAMTRPGQARRSG
jgi:hypothetical protein